MDGPAGGGFNNSGERGFTETEKTIFVQNKLTEHSALYHIRYEGPSPVFMLICCPPKSQCKPQGVNPLEIPPDLAKFGIQQSEFAELLGSAETALDKSVFGMCPCLFAHFIIPFSPICAMCYYTQMRINLLKEAAEKANARISHKNLQWESVNLPWDGGHLFILKSLNPSQPVQQVMAAPRQQEMVAMAPPGGYMPMMVDANGQPIQPMMVDANGQPIQPMMVDANGQPIQPLMVDANGQPMTSNVGLPPQPMPMMEVAGVSPSSVAPGSVMGGQYAPVAASAPPPRYSAPPKAGWMDIKKPGAIFSSKKYIVVKDGHLNVYNVPAENEDLGFDLRDRYSLHDCALVVASSQIEIRIKEGTVKLSPISESVESWRDAIESHRTFA